MGEQGEPIDPTMEILSVMNQREESVTLMEVGALAAGPPEIAGLHEGECRRQGWRLIYPFLVTIHEGARNGHIAKWKYSVEIHTSNYTR